MAEQTNLAADFVTILSSEMIAEIVEAYFNAEMYKKTVKIVDLKPTADGYAFSLAFVEQFREVTEAEAVELVQKRAKDEQKAALDALERYYKDGTELTEAQAIELKELTALKPEPQAVNGVKRTKNGRFTTSTVPK